MGELDLTALRKAAQALKRAAAVWEGLTPVQQIKDIGETVRAGVIQSFEFTYELCWKFMRRWLEMNIAPDAADGVSRRELFRLSAEQKLIDDVDIWMEFHTARNITSHVYDEEKAALVLEKALSFYTYAALLLERLEEKE